MACSGRFGELEQKIPEVFSVCAVTRAMEKSRTQRSSDQDDMSSGDSFMANPGDLSSSPVGSSPKTGFSSTVKELGSKVCVS